MTPGQNLASQSRSKLTPNTGASQERSPLKRASRVFSWNALSDRRARGDVLIPGDLFARKLGKNALALWRLLIRWRTPGGLAWPSKAALARHAEITIHQVRTALRRLKRLLLLADVGQIERHGVSLWHYEVLGEPADGRLRAVWVQARAAREIQKVGSHGGRRRGSGRPKGSKNQAAPLNNQAAPRITLTQTLPPTGGESETRVGAREEALMEESTLGSGAGASLRAEFDAALAHAVNIGVMPDDPRHDGITAQRVPPPERLDPGASMEERVNILLACYRGAVTARTGKRNNIFLRGGVKKSRYWKALCGAAKALEEHDIPPAAWASWSVGVWHDREDKKDPPLTWVWGAKRIVEKRGWFRTASDDFSAAKLLWTDSGRHVVTTRDHAVKLLWTEYDGGPITEASASTALAAVLGASPGDAMAAWHDLVRLAQRDCDRAAAQLKAAPATGEVWLWG